MLQYKFSRNEWNKNDFFYAYSPACLDRVEFKQEEDCIISGIGKSFLGYEYISIVNRQTQRSGVCLHTECSFERFGAPLIVFSDDIQTNERGERIYGKYFEIVAYEEGINIWKILPYPENQDCPIKPTLLATKKFAVAGNTRIDMKVQIDKDCIKTWVNEEFLEVEVEDLPTTEFWVGITACEGINRFYSFTIDNAFKKTE